jgi:hypothetical protein
MIFIHKKQNYNEFGTNIPDCDAQSFSTDFNGINRGGISIASNTEATRIMGARINGQDYFFNSPVVIIDRLLYGQAGIVPDVSEKVGNAMRDLYRTEFNLTGIPFLFTCGWDTPLNLNYTSHAIDNSGISGHNNVTSYMIYQFRNNNIWSASTGVTYNLMGDGRLAINSDIDPRMTCALSDLKFLEIKSLFTNTPDIIMENIRNNPDDLTISLTYVTHLTEEFITRLLYPLLNKGMVNNSKIQKIGDVNLNNSLRNALIALGWNVLL